MELTILLISRIRSEPENIIFFKKINVVPYDITNLSIYRQTYKYNAISNPLLISSKDDPINFIYLFFRFRDMKNAVHII